MEGRAEDLSQTRPEYGHATNALCFVGRRDWSRGLFLDRRAFLTSYDPAQDDESSSILKQLLAAVIPVCAGINLEYYFSYVDPTGYGCGTKLPHNITSLLGVMDGAASDLRPGLPWQMVEIHEPVRLLFVIETTPKAMQRIIDDNEAIAQLVHGDWVQLAVFDPNSPAIYRYFGGEFVRYAPESPELPIVESSIDWYRGQRDHLGFASIGQYAQLRRHLTRVGPIMSSDDWFVVLGICVVASPAVLLAAFGLSTLLGRKLSERSMARLTEASVVFGLLASLAILGLMLATQSKARPDRIWQLGRDSGTAFPSSLEVNFRSTVGSVRHPVVYPVRNGWRFYESLSASRAWLQSLLFALRVLLAGDDCFIPGRND